MPSTETLPTLDDPPTMDKPLPPPPPNSLPFPGLHQLLALQNEPKLPPSGLELDETSNRHVEELLRQSLKSAKVNEKLYLDSILSALRDLAASLTPLRLSAVSESQIALWKTRDAATSHSESKEKGRGKDKKGKEKEMGSEPSAADAEAEEEQVRAKRREEWRAAMLLLEEGELSEGEEKEEPRIGHAQEPTDASTWSNIAEPVKLSLYELEVSTTETTMGAVKDGRAKLGVSYIDGQWIGNQRLFGADTSPNIEGDDLKLVTLVGGTLQLICTPKDRTRLERILELLAFAVLSLKLETHLLRDVSCPRPPIEEEEADVESNPTTPTANTPTTLNFPSTSLDLSSLPSEEWPKRPRKLSRRSKFHNKSNSLWGLLLGSPRTTTTPPTSPPPLQSPTAPSFVSNSTSSSASFVSFPSSTDSTTPKPTPRRMKDKLKGIGEGFRFRKQPKAVEAPSPREASDFSVDGDRGWDFLSVGLGIFGAGGSITEDSKPKVGVAVKVKEESEAEPTDRFEKVIRKMQGCILSVSPDVVYPPPHLLVRLRQQEIAQAEAEALESPPPPPPKPLPSPPPRSPPPTMHRMRSYAAADAHTLALDFATGGDSPTSQRHTRAVSSGTALTASSRATRITLDARAGLASLLTNNNSLGGCFRHQSMQFLAETVVIDAPEGTVPCKPPQWLQFPFYQHDSATSSKDTTLGQLIERLIDRKDAPCDTSECKEVGSAHSLLLHHSKERLSISLSTIPQPYSERQLKVSPSDSTRPRIATWSTCNVCHAQTSPTLLSIAAYSYSFSKWCELVIYDTTFVPFPDLCDHVKDEPGVLVRSFAMGGNVVNVVLDKLELFELRLPTAVDPSIAHEATTVKKEADLAPVDGLRKEIESFYESVGRRLDVLADSLTSDDSEALDEEILAELEGAGDGNGYSPASKEPRRRRDSDSTIVDLEEDGQRRRNGTLKAPHPLLELISKLHRAFDLDEGECLAFVDELNPEQVNGARFLFRSKAMAAKARLSAWETKHASELSGQELETAELVEPDFFGAGMHLFPVEADAAVVVREKELSSLIAFTLSARAFKEEVASPSIAEPSSRKVTPQGLWDSPSDQSSSRKSSRSSIPTEFLHPSSLSSSGASRSSSPLSKSRLSSSSSRSTPQLDPDDSDVEFAPQEEVEYTAKRKKRARPGSRMMLGGLGRKKSSDSTTGFFRSSPLSTPTLEGAPFEGPQDKRTSRVEPISESVLEDLVVASAPPTPPRTPSGQPGRAVPSIISTLTKRQASEASTSSIISFPAVEIDPSHRRDGTVSSISSLASLASSSTGSSIRSYTPSVSEEEDEGASSSAADRPSRFLNVGGTLSGTLSGLSGFLSLPEAFRGQSGTLKDAPLPPDASEHVKFSFRRGTKSFRVTAWYAQRFADLRARCGLSENLFVESLSRCEDLNTSGGKSSAAFWTTADRRFLLKELVTVYGVSERESFLNFAPQLLEYLMHPERPSLLAKIVGFYSVKTKVGKEARRLDLIVMENILYGRTITRQYDLKGITTRMAKPKPGCEGEAATGWDADWLSGSTRLLLYSHSKTLLRDSLLNDSDFLSSSGNIDYSLLVGVDDERKELVVGLIDVLGVFDIRKRLEHQIKTGAKLATGADAATVTVLPPEDYASRFRHAMETAFVAIPEKFSKLNDAPMDLDPRLASVL